MEPSGDAIATARCTSLRSCRTLPGQANVSKMSSVSAVRRTPGLPSRSQASRRKNVLRCGISSRRSRRGGTWIRMTLRR